ncbi:MFS transporter [uncultured Helicobacter sp.]|uniref:MFS transporter n=1 Tax=uncultured Helicobacter sp. TaxID=175537 RepID=UPI00374E9C5A
MSKKWYFWLSLAMLISISLNLRAPINALGPMVESIKEHYGISSATFGLLSAIPVVAFGSISFIVSYFSNIKILFIALCSVALGEITRSYGGMVGLFVGTAFIGAGIAVANVLLPGFVKKKFPQKTTAMMALYSFVLNISSVLGIWLALPLAYNLGVLHALAFWLIFSMLSIILYIPEIRNKRISRTKVRPKRTKSLMREWARGKSRFLWACRDFWHTPHSRGCLLSSRTRAMGWNMALRFCSIRSLCACLWRLWVLCY